MMIEVWLILYVIGAHWVADFIFQDDRWANDKWHSVEALAKHVGTYTLVMTFFMFLVRDYVAVVRLSLDWLVMFALMTFALHFIIDFVTSKAVHYKFERGLYGSKIPNLEGFTIIGFDQWLHYASLFGTFVFLNQHIL